jgi:hypothetical protein
MFVPVVDQHQQPLMPTTPARARRWIKSGKATSFWKGGIFCVRLNQEPSARHIQPVVVGIDPGSKEEALVVKSAAHTYLNIQADAVTWVKEAVQTRQGWETKRLRETLGLRKSSNKLAEAFSAHCVDAWVLAWAVVGGQPTPDQTRLLCVTPLRWHRRQLHRFQPERGGLRKPYGGTRSLGLTRGTLVQHPKYGLVYVGGTLQGKLSLHGLSTGERLCQKAKLVDCRPRVVLRWRARLLPTPIRESGLCRRGVL